MWINWKPARLLSLATADKDRLLKLVPGVQLVSDADWNFIRPAIADKIKRGDIVAYGESIKTDRKGEKGVSLPDLYVGTDFKDFSVEQQDELIRECLSVDCLRSLRESAPESVRILIANQIEKMTARPDKK